MIMKDFSVITRGSHMFFERRLEKYDVNMSELMVLLYLAQVPIANQDSVARHYKLDKGSIAKTITKLEKKGFIDRRQNKDNRRENLVTLTEKGSKLIHQIQQLMVEWEASVFANIPEKDKEHFVQTLTQIAMNVEQIVNER